MSAEAVAPNMETVGRSVRASMDFNGPLNALSTSPNNHLIAVGGRDVLKVVALEPGGFAERRNLRVGKSNLSFSTNDIRWHPQSDSLLATAATNGAVVIWNLQREGFKNVQERVLSGHRRAVNRICWHPNDSNLLLSGSQDGTIKLWDRRGKSPNTYQPKSESVRDVRVSPFQSNKFAAAFENGIVQIWDTRKNSQPELKFQAHKGLVLSVDWHPRKANVLASGGRDRYVKVWDFADVRQPRHTIQTIASVGRVAWRPTCADHIATSASLMDNSIHVWDIQRPWIPIASMKGHADIASGIQWMDTPASSSMGTHTDASTSEWEGLEYWQHMLACSKDGTLKLHSLADAVKPQQSLPTTALALNSRGQVAFSHDYVDRSCASLSIHRHFNLTSALFSVTDASSSSSAVQKFTSSPCGSYGTDQAEDGFDISSAAGVGGVAKSPSFTSANAAIGSAAGSGNTSNSSVNPGSAGATAGGILRHGAANLSSQNIHALQSMAAAADTSSSTGGGNNLDTRRLSSPVISYSVTSSPGPHFFGTPSSSSIPSSTPRALVALVSMQNVNKASTLEKIFNGDEDAWRDAQDRLEGMQAQFEHSSLLKDAFGFDEDAFRFLAREYVLVDSEMSFAEVCAHNALAAFVAAGGGSTHLSQMWRILHVLYDDDRSSSADVVAADIAANAVAATSTKSERTAATPPSMAAGGTNDPAHPFDMRAWNDTTHVDAAHGVGELGIGNIQDGHLRGNSGFDTRFDQFLDGSLYPSTPPRRGLDADDYSSTASMVAGGDADGIANASDVSGGGAVGATETAMILQQLDHVNPQAMEGFDPYPYDNTGRLGSGFNGMNGNGGGAQRGSHPDSAAPEGADARRLRTLLGGFPGLRYQNSAASSMIVHGSAVHGELRHLRESVLKELLEYYVDLGEVQTAVAIALVINKVTNVESVMGKPWLQQIYMHYIDLLHQFRIYHAANELILNCPDPSIRQMNMRSTTVYFNCASCTKPCETLVNADGESMSLYLCTNCNNATTRCSVCQLPVRGLYVWCSTCSHGGHLEHLSDWFRQEDLCPTGCSHRCSFQLLVKTQQRH